MSAPAPRTSVIVLNHDGVRWLSPCLAALKRQAGAFEVLVVDNASRDGSRELLEGMPGVRLVALDRNAGFAGGNNAGARAARGAEYLAFLNNDTEVEEGWLEALVHALDADPAFALATSHVILLDDPTVVDSAGDGYLRAGGAYKRWHGRRRPPGDRPEEVFGACGAAFVIRRSMFEQLGGFDERFFMVYEDVDLSYRARLAGARCLYVPSAVVRHAGSASLGRESSAAVFYGQRNLEWTWFKNTPLSLLLRGAPAHAVYSVAGLVYYAGRGHLRTAVRAKLAALGGLAAVLRSRRASTVATGEIARVMDRWWWRTKRSEPRWRGRDDPGDR